jgi:hypothetical protein
MWYRQISITYCPLPVLGGCRRLCWFGYLPHSQTTCLLEQSCNIGGPTVPPTLVAQQSPHWMCYRCCRTVSTTKVTGPLPDSWKALIKLTSLYVMPALPCAVLAWSKHGAPPYTIHLRPRLSAQAVPAQIVLAQTAPAPATPSFASFFCCRCLHSACCLLLLWCHAAAERDSCGHPCSDRPNQPHLTPFRRTLDTNQLTGTLPASWSSFKAIRYL